jgi:hypothetical protein
VPEVHKYVAFFVVGLFTIGWLWGLGAWLLKRGPGAWFWRWLAAAQVVAILQALIGGALLVIGYRPITWLHLVYGLGPLVVLVIAHGTARQEQYVARPWVPFAWAAFINFGLTVRALTTGLGG